MFETFANVSSITLKTLIHRNVHNYYIKEHAILELLIFVELFTSISWNYAIKKAHFERKYAKVCRRQLAKINVNVFIVDYDYYCQQ